MIRAWKLFNILRKTSIQFSFSKNTIINSIIMAILGLSVIPWIGFEIIGTVAVYRQLAEYEQTGIILSIVNSSMCFIIFFFGIFYTLSVFYFSQDIEKLLPLPIKSWEIIFAKFMTVVLYEYMLVGIIYLPIFITYGILGSMYPLFYVYGILIGLLLPIIPLIIDSILVMLLMRFTSMGKHKELLSVIAALIVLIVSVGANFFIQAKTRSMIGLDELITILQEGNNSLMQMVTTGFPGLIYGVNALIYANELKGSGSFLVFIVTNISALIVFLLIAKNLYFKGAIGLTDTVSKGRVISHKELKTTLKPKKILISLMIREVKLIIRSPIYLMNGVMANFIMPIMFVFMGILNINNDEGLDQMFRLIADDMYIEYKLLIVFLVGIVLSGINGLAATGISREGNSIYYIKFLPVPLAKQIMAKLYVGTSFAVLGVLIVVGVYIYIGLSFPYVLMSILLGALGAFIMSLHGGIIDVVHPKIGWTNEQQAMKQNLNVLFSIFVAIILCLIYIIITFIIQPSVTMILLIIFGIGGLQVVIAYLILYKVAIPIFLNTDY